MTKIVRTDLNTSIKSGVLQSEQTRHTTFRARVPATPNGAKRGKNFDYISIANTFYCPCPESSVSLVH